MGVGALIDMERKGCEWIVHDIDCDLWVTMVAWVDVPYNDWGDFRRPRAIDISSLVVIFWMVVQIRKCMYCFIMLINDISLHVISMHIVGNRSNLQELRWKNPNHFFKSQC